MSIVAVSNTDSLPVPVSDQAPVVLPTGEPLPGPVPGRPRRGTATIGTLLFITADAMVLAAVVVEPLWRYRVHRWEVTADAVYTLEGWLSRTWRVVPVSRIQTVDVTRGVIQQAFGLATVAVLTASSQGTVQVLHLEADVAARLADDLARRAEQVRDEAT